MAMVMQSGIGISRLLFIFGTSTVLLKTGQLSDWIGKLQLLVKRIENPTDQPEPTVDPLTAEVAELRDLMNEAWNLINNPIQVLNGGSGQSNLSSLVVPTAAFGAAGYGYMRLKGLSFSDLMYVTKRNMENAVADLTKKLQHASDVIADAKKHLTDRIQKLVDKMHKQNETAKKIKDDVSKVQGTVTNIHDDLSVVQHTMAILDGRLNAVIENQVFTNKALDYILNIIWANRVPDSLPGTIPQERPQLPCRSPGMITHPGITYPEPPNLKSIKDISESASDTIMPGGLDKLEQQRRLYLRATPTKYLWEGLNMATPINI